MTKKMTRKEMFTEIKAVVETSNLPAERMAEMTAFIDKQVAQLERKSGSSKPTKKQTENEPIKAKILEHLADHEKVVGADLARTQLENENLKAEILAIFGTLDKPVTITEFCEKVDHPVANLSNQKLSALFNQLVKAEKLTKNVDKKKSYFSLV